MGRIGGGADEGTAKTTAQEDLADLPISSQSDPTTFADAVLQYCHKWRKRSENPEGGVAAFVNDIRTTAGDEERVYSFRYSYGEQLAGCLHRSDPALNSVWRSKECGSTVAELAAAVVDRNLGHAPTVLVDIQAREATYFPNGVLDEFAVHGFMLDGTESVVTGETVRRFLDRFHDVCTRTPTHVVPVWCGPPRYGVPVQRVEDVLRDHIMILARIRFDNVWVQREQDTEDGRADISIAPAVPHNGEPCVLELKVLRSRHFSKSGRNYRGNSVSLKECERHAADGVDQVKAYRDKSNADVAFLCCYDMRDSDDGDAIVRALQTVAEAADVILLRYYMARSHKEMRRAKPDSAYRKITGSRGN